VQLLPQLPQLVLSVLMLVSHPSRLTFSLAEQSPQPRSHVMLHAPPVHAGVPCTTLQPVPHPPQLLVLVAVLVSQPSRLKSSLAEQSLQPTLQAMLHAPAPQLGTPLALLQAAPQPLQFNPNDNLFQRFVKVSMWGAGEGFLEMALNFFRLRRPE